MTTTAAAPSAVNHPPHYQGKGGIEAITVIEAMFDLAGHAPNAVKYLLRYRAKGRPAEDLGKAKWYVDRLISAKGRIDPQPTLGIDHLALIADAFDLTGHVRDAFAHLSEAVIARAEDRYRAWLRNCSHSLELAIAEIERRN